MYAVDVTEPTEENPHSLSMKSEGILLTRSRSRPDVQTCTSWRAPIIWDGMFVPELYDQMHKSSGSSVALTVFAIGRFVFTLTPEHTVAPAFRVSTSRRSAWFLLTLPDSFIVSLLQLSPFREMGSVMVSRRLPVSYCLSVAACRTTHGSKGAVSL